MSIDENRAHFNALSKMQNTGAKHVIYGVTYSAGDENRFGTVRELAKDQGEIFCCKDDEAFKELEKTIREVYSQKGIIINRILAVHAK